MATFMVGDVLIARPQWMIDENTVGRIDGMPVWTNLTPDKHDMEEIEGGAAVRLTVKQHGGMGQVQAEGDANLLPGDENKRTIVLVGEYSIVEQEVAFGRMEIVKETPVP